MRRCARSTTFFRSTSSPSGTRLEIDAERARVDRALREVSVDEIPGMRALFLLRGLGRTGRDTSRPFLGLARLGAVALEDVGGRGRGLRA